MAASRPFWLKSIDDGAEKVCPVTDEASRLASFKRGVTENVTDFALWSHLIFLFLHDDFLHTNVVHLRTLSNCNAETNATKTPCHLLYGPVASFRLGFWCHRIGERPLLHPEMILFHQPSVGPVYEINIGAIAIVPKPLPPSEHFIIKFESM